LSKDGFVETDDDDNGVLAPRAVKSAIDVLE
jgi:hypothetical protein